MTKSNSFYKNLNKLRKRVKERRKQELYDMINDENNKLLSLFAVNFKGNIQNIETSLDYNQAKTDQLIGDMLEKKMKKVIKDKLDNKFNDIIENLLE